MGIDAEFLDQYNPCFADFVLANSIPDRVFKQGMGMGMDLYSSGGLCHSLGIPITVFTTKLQLHK
jgi:hypothetical protein